MFCHIRSFEESKTSGSLMTHGQASMVGVEIYPIWVQIIFYRDQTCVWSHIIMMEHNPFTINEF